MLSCRYSGGGHSRGTSSIGHSRAVLRSHCGAATVPRRSLVPRRQRGWACWKRNCPCRNVVTNMSRYERSTCRGRQERLRIALKVAHPAVVTGFADDSCGEADRGGFPRLDAVAERVSPRYLVEWTSRPARPNVLGAHFGRLRATERADAHVQEPTTGSRAMRNPGSAEFEHSRFIWTRKSGPSAQTSTLEPQSGWYSGLTGAPSVGPHRACFARSCTFRSRPGSESCRPTVAPPCQFTVKSEFRVGRGESA